MKTAAQQWFSSSTSVPGLLGCGLRQPDGAALCHAVASDFPAAKIEQILSLYETLHAPVLAGDTMPQWTTWSFDQGHLRYVIRPDGWILALIARSDSEASDKLDSLSEEFLLLQPNS